MSAVDDLKARRDAICAELASLSSSKAGGKPNVSVDGQTTDHVGYKRGLYAELKDIDEAIARINATTDDGGGTFMIESLGN